MLRILLVSALFVVSLFLGDWVCSRAHGADTYGGAVPVVEAGPGCHDASTSFSHSCTGSCTSSCTGSCTASCCGGCVDSGCPSCSNLQSLGRGFWARLAALGTLDTGMGIGSSCAGCARFGDGGANGMSLCNFGHACDLQGRFDGCGNGCGGLFGFGLLGSCACGGPGAGDVTGAVPGYCGMPAPSYPVPHPVPAYVGYTYLTYPPMMPHHSLPHYRGTYSYRHAPGLSRTTVHWRSPKIINTAAKLHHIIELPR